MMLITKHQGRPVCHVLALKARSGPAPAGRSPPSDLRGGFDRLLVANAAFVAVLVTFPVVGHGWFGTGGILIVLIGALSRLSANAQSADSVRQTAILGQLQ